MDYIQYGKDKVRELEKKEREAQYKEPFEESEISAEIKLIFQFSDSITSNVKSCVEYLVKLFSEDHRYRETIEEQNGLVHQLLENRTNEELKSVFEYDYKNEQVFVTIFWFWLFDFFHDKGTKIPKLDKFNKMYENSPLSSRISFLIETPTFKSLPEKEIHSYAQCAEREGLYKTIERVLKIDEPIFNGKELYKVLKK